MVKIFPITIVKATRPNAVLKAKDSVVVNGEFGELGISDITANENIILEYFSLVSLDDLLIRTLRLIVGNHMLI